MGAAQGRAAAAAAGRGRARRRRVWPRRGTGRAARARERRRGGRRRCDAVAVVRGGGATGGAGKELAGRAATVGGDAGHVATARALSARPGGGLRARPFFFCLRAFRRGPARTQCQSGERDKASGQTFSMAQSPAGSSLRAHTHRFSAQRTRSGACGFSVARAQVEIAVHAFRLRHSLYMPRIVMYMIDGILFRPPFSLHLEFDMEFDPYMDTYITCKLQSKLKM